MGRQRIPRSFSILESSHGTPRVTVTADSPLIAMFSMMIGNPAMIPAGSELIKYGRHNAILETRKNDQGFKLQIVIDSSLIDVDARGLTDEQLLRMFDQAAVDRVAAALGG